MSLSPLRLPTAVGPILSTQRRAVSSSAAASNSHYSSTYTFNHPGKGGSYNAKTAQKGGGGGGGLSGNFGGDGNVNPMTYDFSGAGTTGFGDVDPHEHQFKYRWTRAPPRDYRKEVHFQSPESPTSTYAIMRRPSHAEIATVDSRVDVRLLEQQHQDLAKLLQARGVPVWMLPADEQSPFSSRIGRYVTGMPAHCVLCPHPDNLFHGAWLNVSQLMNLKKIDLKVFNMNMAAENLGAQDAYIDPRDILRVNLRMIVLVRDGGTTDEGAALMQEFCRDRRTWAAARGSAGGLAPEYRNNQANMYHLRTIDGNRRGMHLPLSRYMCSPGDNVLAVDRTCQEAIDAVHQSGLTLADDITVTLCPPYVTESCIVETRCGQGGNPLTLLPAGLKDAEEWFKNEFAHALDLEIIDWSEWLKLGVQLGEMFYHVRPMFDKEGRMVGSYSHGHQGRDYFAQGTGGSWAGWAMSELAGFNRFYGEEGYDPWEHGWDPYRDSKDDRQASAKGMPLPDAKFRRWMERTKDLDKKIALWKRKIGIGGGIQSRGFETAEQWEPGEPTGYHEWQDRAQELYMRKDPKEAKLRAPSWAGGGSGGLPGRKTNL